MLDTLHKQTVKTLGEYYVDVSLFTQQHFVSWLRFQVKYHEPETCATDLLKAWMRSPMLVADNQLQFLISMQPSTAASPRLSNGSVCYIRSWELKASELGRVILHTRQNRQSQVPFLELGHWESVIAGADPDTILTVRFVGHTTVSTHSLKPPRS